MRYQARKKVQWSANNLLTSTSQTQVIKYENKRKKFWFSCILKIISLVKNIFHIMASAFKLQQ